MAYGALRFTSPTSRGSGGKAGEGGGEMGLIGGWVEMGEKGDDHGGRSQGEKGGDPGLA